MTRLYSLLILALTGVIVMLEPDIAEPDTVEPEPLQCDTRGEGVLSPIWDTEWDEAPPLSDAPLPDAFQRWMDGRHD
jgi:hypothetical protein